MVNGRHAALSDTASNRRPRLVSVVALDGHKDSALLALAAALAEGFEAPVAAAIVEAARERDIEFRPIERFHRTTAMGVVGTVAGHAVVLGNAAFFRDLRLSIENLGEWPDRLRGRGEDVLLVAIDGRTAGFLSVADDAT
jgi:Cu+-exporting ATPase